MAEIPERILLLLFIKSPLDFVVPSRSPKGAHLGSCFKKELSEEGT